MGGASLSPGGPALHLTPHAIPRLSVAPRPSPEREALSLLPCPTAKSRGYLLLTCTDARAADRHSHLPPRIRYQNLVTRLAPRHTISRSTQTRLSMIDRRGFVQSLIALGAAAGLRPATTRVRRDGQRGPEESRGRGAGHRPQGRRELRRHPHQPLSQSVPLHARPPRPEHRQHRGLRVRRPRAGRRHLGLREQQRGDQGRDCCDRAAGGRTSRARTSR